MTEWIKKCKSHENANLITLKEKTATVLQQTKKTHQHNNKCKQIQQQRFT